MFPIIQNYVKHLLALLQKKADREELVDVKKWVTAWLCGLGGSPSSLEKWWSSVWNLTSWDDKNGCPWQLVEKRKVEDVSNWNLWKNLSGENSRWQWRSYRTILEDNQVDNCICWSRSHSASKSWSSSKSRSQSKDSLCSRSNCWKSRSNWNLAEVYEQIQVCILIT